MSKTTARRSAPPGDANAESADLKMTQMQKVRGYLMVTKLTLEFLRVIVLDWALDPSMLWRFRSNKYRGLVMDPDEGFVYKSADSLGTYRQDLN